MNNLEQQIYARRFDDVQKARKRALWSILVGDFLQRYIAATDAVLDVAGGQCEFINAVRCARKTVVDVNPDAGRYANPDVRVLLDRADRMQGVADGEAQVVFVSNFFEHLPDGAALLAVLEEIRRVLQPGGRLLVIQPNIRFAYREYWDFVDHRLPLSDRSLTEALGLAGFDVERCVPRFLPYSPQGRLGRFPWLLRAYLRLPWAWPLVGKQMFVVARKAGGRP